MAVSNFVLVQVLLVLIHATAYSTATVIGQLNTIDVVVNANLSGQAQYAIRSAIDRWQAMTCLYFTNGQISSNNTVKQCLIFKAGPTCSFAKEGRTTTITIALRCSMTGSVAELMGYALGLTEEQKREDRDHFVTVPSGYDKHSHSAKSAEMCMAYNYGSITHEGPSSYTLYGEEETVIEAKDPLYQYTIGQRVDIAITDAMQVNILHKCGAVIGGKCANGGYENLQFGEVCVCPAGFEGETCEDLPKGSNMDHCLPEMLMATKNYEKLKYQISQKSADEPAYCTWWIQAPPGHSVSLIIQNVSVTSNDYDAIDDGCSAGALELKIADYSTSGSRHCFSNTPSVGKTIVSESNLVPVIAALAVTPLQHKLYMDFTLLYKIGPPYSKSKAKKHSCDLPDDSTVRQATITYQPFDEGNCDRPVLEPESSKANIELDSGSVLCYSHNLTYNCLLVALKAEAIIYESNTSTPLFCSSEKEIQKHYNDKRIDHKLGKKNTSHHNHKNKAKKDSHKTHQDNNDHHSHQDSQTHQHSHHKRSHQENSHHDNTHYTQLNGTFVFNGEKYLTFDKLVCYCA